MEGSSNRSTRRHRYVSLAAAIICALVLIVILMRSRGYDEFDLEREHRFEATSISLEARRGDAGDAHPTTIPIENGSNAAVGSLIETVSVRVRIELRDEVDDSPIEGATIELFNCRNGIVHTMIAADVKRGTYEIDAELPLVAKVNAEGYARTTQTIKTNDTLMKLHRAVDIHVRCVDRQMRPLAGIGVILVPPQRIGGSHWRHAAADLDKMLREVDGLVERLTGATDWAADANWRVTASLDFREGVREMQLERLGFDVMCLRTIHGISDDLGQVRFEQVPLTENLRVGLSERRFVEVRPASRGYSALRADEPRDQISGDLNMVHGQSVSVEFVLDKVRVISGRVSDDVDLAIPDVTAACTYPESLGPSRIGRTTEGTLETSGTTFRFVGVSPGRRSIVIVVPKGPSAFDVYRAIVDVAEEAEEIDVGVLRCEGYPFTIRYLTDDANGSTATSNRQLFIRCGFWTTIDSTELINVNCFVPFGGAVTIKGLPAGQGTFVTSSRQPGDLGSHSKRAEIPRDDEVVY